MKQLALELAQRQLEPTAPKRRYGRRSVFVVLAVVFLVVALTVGLSGNSGSNSQAPMVVSIQTLVNAYSNPNDAQCIANAKCPSEDALYVNKTIQTTGATDSVAVWTGPAWDSSVGEYFVSLHAPDGAFRSIAVYFAKDSGVTSHSFAAGMNLIVVGTFVGLRPTQTGCCVLRVQNAELLNGLISQTAASSSATMAACGPAEQGSCGI